MRVVDQNEQRRFFRGRSQQAQDSHVGGEPVAGNRAPSGKGTFERRPLRGADVAEMPHDRGEKLREASEGKVGLGLQSAGRKNLCLSRVLMGVGEEPAFPIPGSPRTTSAPPPPAAARLRNSCMRASSGSRPMSARRFPSPSTIPRQGEFTASSAKAKFKLPAAQVWPNRKVGSDDGAGLPAPSPSRGARLLTGRSHSVGSGTRWRGRGRAGGGVPRHRRGPRP